jgi:hypothetical protein
MDFQTKKKQTEIKLIKNLKRIINKAHYPTGRANLFTLIFGKLALVKVMTRRIN